MTASKILIVEDDLAHAHELQKLLESEGHVVMGPAPNCSSALEILWRERPDLAFVVTHLGEETCEAVLDECDLQDVPVIITSAVPDGLPDFVGERSVVGKPVLGRAVSEALERLLAA